MKALNRAIARTVSQLARYGREGGHVPMLMALENHLDALLTMERKQLEAAGMKFATLTGAGAVDVFASNLSALQQQLAEKATPLQPHANDNAQAVTSAPQEPPSLAPSQWMAGDRIVFIGRGERGFTYGKAYEIESIDALSGLLKIQDDDGNGVESFNRSWIINNFRNYSQRAENQQPAPDAIDMADPRNWQAGDVLRCARDCLRWEAGQEGIVTYSDGNFVRIKGHIAGQHVSWPLRADAPVAEYFTWLRHGNGEVAA